MGEFDHLCGLPDGSLTRQEVSILLDRINIAEGKIRELRYALHTVDSILGTRGEGMTPASVLGLSSIVQHALSMSGDER